MPKDPRQNEPIYAVGNNVRLKGGGPIMTVVGLFNCAPGEYQDYECGWFTDDGMFYKERFPEEALKGE